MSQNNQIYRNGIPVNEIDDPAQQMSNLSASFNGGAWEQTPQIPWGDWTPEQDAAFRAAAYGNGYGN
jgi:hypothetical protein